MIAASSRQATSGSPASGQSARPTAAVVASTAITASTNTGATSSSRRRTSIVSAASNSRIGRKMYRNPLEVIGKSRISSAISLNASVSGVLQQERRGRADEHADHREQHGMGQAEPRGERLQHADQDQQRGDREQNMSQIQHSRGRPPAGAAGLLA